MQPVKEPAKIGNGVFLPVQLIGNLHFKIDQSIVIQPNIDIQAAFFVFNCISRDDTDQNFHGNNFLFGEMEQGTDQSAEDFIVICGFNGILPAAVQTGLLPSYDDRKDIGKQEYEYSLCAKECGIEMTQTRLLTGSMPRRLMGTE